MGEPLLSPHWPRVASLHPRLTGSVTITAQQVRHERWYVIADRVSGRQLRVNALGHELVGRLDGRLTLQQIWDALVWRLGGWTACVGLVALVQLATIALARRYWRPGAPRPVVAAG